MPRGSSRGFEEISVRICTAQAGKERFPNRDCPTTATGRNNLSAISTELNLYFVAHQDKIHAHRPWLPSQRLSPAIFEWTLPTSAPGLQGYIDRWNPHAVNAMLIDSLGDREVLICACDDGDVLLYYTSTLGEIIRSLNHISLKVNPPRPLVIQNVGRSAWGLAVHKNARMLAVSCNTHTITVFAFALTDDSTLYDDPDTEWQFPGRSKDTSLTLSGHHANIPNIAFFNSDRDKEGRYLVSTDLTGLIVIWDLRERTQITQIVPSEISIHRNPNSGWSVVCLDPSWFMFVKNDMELLGCKVERDQHGTYDVTQARLGVKDASIHYPELLRAGFSSTDPRFFELIRDRVAETRTQLLNMIEAREAREQREATATDDDDEALEEVESANATAMQLQLELEEALDVEDDDELDLDDELDEEDEVDMEVDIFSDLNDLTPENNTIPSRSPIRSIQEGELTQGPGLTSPFGASRRSTRYGSRQNFTASVQNARSREITQNHRAASRPITDEDDSVSEGVSDDARLSSPAYLAVPRRQTTSEVDPQNTLPSLTPTSIVSVPSISSEEVPFLLVHTGQDYVSMQKAPFDRLSLISRDPCHQHLPSTMAWLIHHDRLHLTKVIPELSLFITATAAGRAAIYSLTRRIKTTNSSSIQDEYALRLDAILPRLSQEQKGQRPASFLIGIAAAPLQGMSGSEDATIGSRRWRLLLTYHDGTILSYELWRHNGPLQSAGVMI